MKIKVSGPKKTKIPLWDSRIASRRGITRSIARSGAAKAWQDIK
jgi:hypothetical protein